MKKCFLSILFAVVLIFSLFSGCKEEKQTFTVTAISIEYYKRENMSSSTSQLLDKYGPSSPIATRVVEKGEVVGHINLHHDRETYKFLGWYTDEDYIYQWNPYKDAVMCDLTLYAKWEKL